MKRNVEIIVLSGGVDSATLAHKLVSDGINLQAVHVNAGFRKSESEIASAKNVANKLKIPLDVIDLSGFSAISYSFLEREIQNIPAKLEEPLQEKFVKNKFIVYVPVWLSAVSYYALLRDIRVIHIAFIKEQFESNPGLSIFVDSWAATIGNLNPNRFLSISTPFRGMDKSKIVELGKELMINYEDTWSCYNGTSFHCGECGGCLSRRMAFNKSAFEDTTKYLSYPQIPEELFSELR